MKKKRYLKLCFVGAMCALLLSGCGGSEKAEPDTKKEYEVTLETETKEAPEPESEESENAGETGEDTSSNEVDPEFKAAMDSYEAFFHEYCNFMRAYNESSDPAALAGEYADYMKQYAETMDKLSQIDESALSSADALYYAEVVGRITQEMAEVGRELES